MKKAQSQSSPAAGQVASFLSHFKLQQLLRVVLLFYCFCGIAVDSFLSVRLGQKWTDASNSNFLMPQSIALVPRSSIELTSTSLLETNQKQFRRKSSSKMFNSLSSFFNFASKPKNDQKVIEQRAVLKQRLYELCKNTENGNKCSEEQRNLIEEKAQELAKINPLSKIASAKEMDGAWTLLYTTNGGSSSGKLGPFVGNVIQDINVNSNSYDNIVALGNGVVEGRLTATWNTLDSNVWEVVFQNLVFKVLGLKVIEKELKAKGIWRMTYLDDNLRILYAKGGKNTKQENIYILAKD